MVHGHSLRPSPIRSAVLPRSASRARHTDPEPPRFGGHVRVPLWIGGLVRIGGLTALLSSCLAAYGSPSAAANSEVTVVPVADGNLGAWLAIGPIAAPSEKGRTLPNTSIETQVLKGVEEASLTARMGSRVQTAQTTPPSSTGSTADDAEARTWRVIAGDGLIELIPALGRTERESFGYLYGVLHLSQPLRGALLIGVSDGIKVWVDGRARLTNDPTRFARDDEEIVPLDLAPGAHSILLKLHRRQQSWAVRVRVVDQSLSAPAGAFFRLPGTTAREARAAADHLVALRIDRGLERDAYRPSAEVRFGAGLPEGIDRAILVQTATEVGNESRVRFRATAGQLPPAATGVGAFRVDLPPIDGAELADLEQRGGRFVVRVTAAGKTLEAKFAPRPWMRQALADAARLLERCDAQSSPFLSDPDVVRATVEHLAARIRKDIGTGEADLDPTQAEARTLHEWLGDLDARRDPLQAHAGVMRLAYRSALDGGLSPYGLHVPASFVAASAERNSGKGTRADAGKRYPLIVALHGMNGKPLSMMSVFFGKDDPNRDADWEDRHPAPAPTPSIDTFVLAPNAFGNAMYRELGEADVMDRLDWAMRAYPIDPNRVTITGLSMGGTGTAYVAFHYPDRFAAAEPLCGYHSYFIRGDIAGKPMRAWERLLCEQRSATMWAENGLHIPLFVWHGKRDYPEKNSGILIQRYKDLGYSVEDEHPNVGHEVWRFAYDELGGYKWLDAHHRVAHPKHVVFKTDTLRYANNAWVHVRALAQHLEFGQVDATVRDAGAIDVTTSGVTAFALDRDAELVSTTGPVRVRVDGAELVFDASTPLELVRKTSGWAKGAPQISSTEKRAGVSGPIRDIFYEPLVFVYGTQDPQQVRANAEVARAWAHIRWGVDAKYPVLADTELDDTTSASHSLVLVGNAASNRAVRELETSLPFRVVGDKVLAYPRTSAKAGEKAAPIAWRGTHLGVAFIYPNPKHPNRYVLLIEGTSSFGTLRSLALPDLLPDYIVYDERIASARGQILLGNTRPVAAGLFERDWSLKSP